MEIQFTGEILNYHIYTQIISILHVSKFESAISNVIKRFISIILYKKSILSHVFRH